MFVCFKTLGSFRSLPIPFLPYTPSADPRTYSLADSPSVLSSEISKGRVPALSNWGAASLILLPGKPVSAGGKEGKSFKHLI